MAYLGPVGGKAGIQIFQSRHTGLSKDTSLSFESGLRNVYLFHLGYLIWLLLLIKMCLHFLANSSQLLSHCKRIFYWYI